MRGLTPALAFVAALAAAAQDAPRDAVPTQAAPVFEVGVDVVAVDVSVVDSQGRPLLGLRPEDFEIEVGGRPRVVASAEYLGRDLEPPRAAAPKPAHYSSNDDALPGRLVLLLVDRGNIQHGNGRAAIAAADRFLGTLAPSDRVGLAVVPGPGPTLEFTHEHTQVRQALKHVVGQANRAGFQVPLSEALALVVYNDRLRWQQFVELECGRFLIASQLDQCVQQMEAEAQQVYLNHRERSVQSQRALETVLLSLRGVPGPKTVVLISEGLAVASPGDTRRLGEIAAEAQVTLFVLLLDSSGVDAAYSKEELATPEERELETSALYDLAALARGAVLPVIGSADPPFQRIARELMGYYMVGFEPLASDRDGKSRDIKVTVKRDRVTVRSRGLLNIPATAPSAQQVLTTALRSPLVERGLGVRAASYARPAPGGKVRLLLAAEVARARSPVSVGFVLLAPGGKVAASRLVEGLSASDGLPVLYSGEAIVDPGSYTLRLAALDAGGRRGSVHHETKAAVVSAGGLLISDLLLAPPSSGALRPVVDFEAGGSGMLAFVELGGRDAATLASAAVALELAESADGAALLRVPADTSVPDGDGVRVARVTLAGGLLPPGEYVARAAVSADGQPVASLTRPFRIAAPRPGAAASRAPLAALLTEQRPYERAELLTPELLAQLMDRMAELVPGPAPEGVLAAEAEGRAGRPEAMLARLADAGGSDARVSFLRGVSYYARGNLNAALTQLQATLRARGDLLPVAVYMGACYAAGGKDLDAIGAWQTALIGEGGSPTLYKLLAEALMRVREADQAIAILEEGLAAFPEDQALRMRLGLAHAVAGHSEEALALLGAWVEAHPDDTSALFATLALLFDGFSREAAGAGKIEEQQRLRRYARAYIDGKGPNREVVERWLRYLDSRAGG
jgi:VWFA-related protein